jgi:hypothetical protein
MIRVTAVDLGSRRTQVSIGGRSCTFEDREDAFDGATAPCPTEILAAAVAG